MKDERHAETGKPQEFARPVITSIGVENGDSVIRLAFPDGRIRKVSTNLVGFAMLAAMGVRVSNAS